VLLFKIQEIISALKSDLLYRIQERLDDLVNSPKGWKRWVAESSRIGLKFSCQGRQKTATQLRSKTQKASFK